MVDLDSGLVLHLSMSEGSGTKVKDKSKYQNNGVVNGAVFLKPYQNDTTDEGEAPLVVYDDDETFWSVTSSGFGSISAPTLSEETTIKQKGTSSLKIVVGVGAVISWYIYHDYGSAQDWSKYDFLSLWFYGSNSGATIQLEARTTHLGGNGYYTNIVDNFSGWRRFIVSLERFLSFGSPSWTNINSIDITGTTTGTWYLDRTIVDVGNWRHGEALDFDGTDDKIEVTDVASLRLNDAITVIAWVNAETLTSRDILIRRAIAGPINYRFFLDSGGYLNMEIFDGVNDYSLSDTDLFTTGWHQVAFTWTRGGNGVLYRDGVARKTSVSTITGDINGVGDYLYIGRYSTPQLWFDGKIDEVRIYNRTLSSEEIRTLYNEKAFDLERGLVLHMSMEEGSGTKTYDRSKHQNHGTITEATWVDGKFGKALDFDGINDYVELVDNNSLVFGDGSFSIASWFKITEGGAHRAIVAKGHFGMNNTFLVSYELATQVMRFNVQDSAGNSIEILSIGTISLNTWYHIIAVRDKNDSKIKIYINGVLNNSGSDTLGSIMSQWNLFIGCTSFFYSYPMKGIIDEVRIYNRALSAEEIRTLYNMTTR